MLVKFCSTIAITGASGAEIDQGYKLRWLGEAVWFAYRFVGDQIHWEPADGRSAKATLLGNGLPASTTSRSKVGYESQQKASGDLGGR